MDYDQSKIAATYDEARGLTSARQRRWRDLLAAHVERSRISLIVDLGCGTGRFSEILLAEFGARIIGFDPSESMIEQARQKSATGMIEFEQAWAHELPLADGCVDLVFMSQVYHHLPDAIAAARECRRILRAGGYLCIRTATSENDVVIPRFFPATRAMLDADLPSGDDIKTTFVTTGFVTKHHAIITEMVAADWPEFVRKSALRADSFLARLSDAEFNQGMAALRAHVAENPNDAVTEQIDWWVFTKGHFQWRIGDGSEQ